MPVNQIDDETLILGYRRMRTIRAFEQRISKEFAAGTVPGMTHLYIGQEAVAAGVCAHLTDADSIASTHRGHGHAIAKGCDIPGMALELFRKEGGICRGKGGSMHIADVSKGMLGANAIVGGASPLAIGAALSAKVRGSGEVSVAFVGDGATNQGTTFEAMNMAVTLALPAIFAIENNGYGEHTGNDYATGADITERTRAFGMPCEKVDGTDFFAVHDAMARAAARARAGEGPSAIEAIAFRWHGHFEGDPQAYRDKSEIERLRESADPLAIFRAKVAEGDLLPADTLDALDREIDALVADAVDQALAAPQPAAEELLTDVYVSY
ncbi:MAG: thiamine pyrophosphate-dependent dehydrogenase E1 component subunit alpha [Caulobacterales bacterium]|nr:thiamine pyrophosphate-dependent dehydrogenase E1 component subunit alpha [Caulobacterales bacterium]